MSGEVTTVQGRAALEELVAQQRERLAGFGHIALLMPGRPGDGRFAVPGMGVYVSKGYPTRPGQKIEEVTYPRSRIAYTQRVLDAAAMVAFGTTNDIKTGAHIEPDEHGRPYSVFLTSDLPALRGLNAVLHVVSSEGWQEVPNSRLPNAKGYVLDGLRYVHDDPEQVAILGTAGLRYPDDIKFPAAEHPEPSRAFYAGTTAVPVIHNPEPR